METFTGDPLSPNVGLPISNTRVRMSRDSRTTDIPWLKFYLCLMTKFTQTDDDDA